MSFRIFRRLRYRRFRRSYRKAPRWLVWPAWAVGILLVATSSTVLTLKWFPPPTTAFMLQSTLPAQYEWTAWDDISPYAALAVVAAEDQKFLMHRGFDFESIEDALREHREGGRLRGASTISQQVAKNLFLWPGKSYARKALEAYFTVLIELTWSKKRILEVYLNIAEFGPGIYGVRTASAAYFQQSPTELTAHEAALLAAVLPSPKRYDARRPSSYVQERRWWIMRQMQRMGGVDFLKDL